MKKQCQEDKHESKKIIIISVIAVVIFSLIFGAIYFYTHYAIIDRKIYKNDITYLRVYELDDNEINEINKCTKIEEMFLSEASENSVSRFINFHNLSDLCLSICEINSSDSEKISHFDNLRDLATFRTTIDFKGFNNDTVSCIRLLESEIKNFKALSECQSLKSIIIYGSTISDNCIVVEDYRYAMKDSSVFASFDYVEELGLDIDKIEDISGILEMDSLKEFKIHEGTISENDKKLLEDKGVSVIYYDYDKNE